MKEGNSLGQAVRQQTAGRLREAAERYEHILDEEPDNVDALHLLGVIRLQAGDAGAALSLFDRALAKAPRDADVYNNRGLALRQLGQLEDAIVSLRQAVALDPGSAQRHNNLGTALEQSGQLEAGRASYTRAVELAPDHAPSHHNLGNVEQQLGNLEQAVKCYRTAATLEPGFAGTWIQLGEVLLRLERLDEATECYERAVSLDSQLASGWDALGRVLLARREFAAAIRPLRRCLELRPDHAEAHHNLGKALFEIGEIEGALEHFRRVLVLGRSDLEESALRTIAVLIPGSPAADNQTVLEARQAWARVALQGVAPVDIARRDSGRKLRIAYVSAFFHAPNWMKPVWGLINDHDRESFEIHLFSDAAFSQIEHGYRDYPDDYFYNISGVSNERVAELIAEREIDILVDLNGYSRPQRLPLFAFRPAPVIAGWFNMYATTGLDCFDYLIGDAHVIPPDEEPSYSESILRVPGSYLTFAVNYPVPEVSPLPWLSAAGPTFGCLASQYKINPRVIEAWVQILSRCPSSRLVLKNATLGAEQNRSYLLARFTEAGIDRARLELEGPEEHYRFLQKYADIDLALDTFPYNGGTTTTEALWQGVPVITFCGDRWAGRTSTTILRSGNLEQFVAPDLEAYVELAVGCASDGEAPERLAELRRTMRERLRNSSICDTKSFARAMEDLYIGMQNRA